MIIRKRLRAEQVRAILELPEEIKDDAMLEIIIRDVAPQEKEGHKAERSQLVRELMDLFYSRIRAASNEELVLEEFITLDEVSWQDLNKAKTIIEAQGYGVTIDEQGNYIRVKVLRRFA